MVLTRCAVTSELRWDCPCACAYWNVLVMNVEENSIDFILFVIFVAAPTIIIRR